MSIRFVSAAAGLFLILSRAALAAQPAHAAGPRDPALSSSPAAVPMPEDTTRRIRLEIPAQPLMEALGEFSRQTGVELRVDAEAARGMRSTVLAGSFTPPEALRHLLVGTGLEARFRGGRAVLVSGGAGATYELAALTVIGERSRGYTAARSTTATRTDTPLRDVPQSVSVVTQAAIADQAMRGMADVVRFVPGVTMGQGEGHRDAPTIRGNSSSADFFVDGVRDDAQYFRDLYNVERVEALTGPNAMIFGRGGGGGVLNRVTKEADWAPVARLTVEGGSFEQRRATLDVGRALGAAVAGRLNAMYETSGGFRDRASLERYGVNPAFALALGARTTLRAGYELFDDHRTVDRGIPSFEGRPASADVRTFFGNPDSSYATMRVHAAGVLVEHTSESGLVLRNRTRFSDYDKFYQNSFPGAMNAAGTEVNLSAYSNATGRRNLFNQTDLSFATRTGVLDHTLLVGIELGRQETENFRRTGYYNDGTTSYAVPFAQPTVSVPITFRQSASDADNRTTATVAAIYAQDQVTLTERWQAVLGLRWDRFQVDFHDNRSGQDRARTDELISPRAGLVFKPSRAASLYGSYGVSYLPSSGDQFASLTATTEALEPERFTNYEVGAKWDVRPAFSLAGALYQLERTNTSAPDPADPSRTVQTGSQRTRGAELSATGKPTSTWQVIGALALQRAEITSQTAAAPAGARVALVPARTASFWNRVQLLPALGVGFGVVHRSEMYAAIDNRVTLPGYTRADAALYLKLAALVSAQLNVENLLDARYYNTSHGNNNIMPGAPRTLRLVLSTRP